MRRLLLFIACFASLARADVPAGTPIRLMLLKDISSSSSFPGDLVPMVVTQDVEVGGRVIIPEGSMAFGKVSWSRREGALSAPLFDKPARLCISLEHLRDLDGNEVKLRPMPGKDSDLQITREMTAKASPAQTQEFEYAWGDPKARPVMEKVHHLFNDSATSLTEKEAEILIQHNVAMPVVQQAIKNGTFGVVINLIRDIKHARMFEVLLNINPTTRPAMAALRAVRELSRLCGGIGTYIEGRFKGRNIRAAAGVELTVYAG